MMRILSLGAGVQSSTLALMIAAGEIEPVEAAVFADTGWEPKKVYEWLTWLEKQLPYPVYRVSNGNIREDILNSSYKGGRFASAPFHLRMPDGRLGMAKRQCTADYKIKPLQKKIRELVGLKPRQRSKGVMAEVLVGISLDEAIRMKPSRVPYIKHSWPLIDLRKTRSDCLSWMKNKNYPLPAKSSCIGCPFHNDDEWRNIKADPESWKDAIEIDKIVRMPLKNLVGERYLHRSCLPLDQVDLSTASERGQGDLWGNECEGMCGV